jgi:hypothetical protein
MSGPTAAQTNLQTAQANFYTQGTQQATQTYGEDQSLLNQMTDIYSPILAKGPNQQGFTAGETENLNAQAVEGTAQNYAGAAKAIGNQEAAQGGGTNPLPSGAQEEQKANIAVSSAQEQSTQEQQIQQASYQQGYNEWQNAGQGMDAVSGQLNPTGYSSTATSAGNAAGTTASAIAQEDNSWVNAAIGAAGAVGAGAMTGFCPARGSVYLMMDGTWKPVETLRVGEQLRGIGGDPQTIEEIQTGNAQVVNAALGTEDGARVYITRTSPTHAFALPLGGFVVVAKATGKQVMTAHGGARVLRVRPHGMDEVFNVITDGSHTYCADGVWALGMGDAERRVDMATWARVGALMGVEG